MGPGMILSVFIILTRRCSFISCGYLFICFEYNVHSQVEIAISDSLMMSSLLLCLYIPSSVSYLC